MFPYWLLFAVFALGAVSYSLKGRDQNRPSPLLLAAAVLIVLAIGLRLRVGADWQNYVVIFDYVGGMSFGEAMALQDPAYMALNTLAHYLNVDIWLVNLICAMIFTWGLVVFAQQQPNPWLTIAVGVPYLIIVVAMGYTRQATAIGLVMAALMRFEQGRYVRFLFLFILAAAFHKSAVLIMPLIVGASIRHRFVIYSIGAVLAGLLFFLFLETFLASMFANYFDAERSSQGAGIRIAMNILPAILYLVAQDRFAVSEQEKRIWRNFAYASLACFVGLLVMSSSTVVDRFALYLIPLQLFVLGRLPYAYPARSMRNGQLVAFVLVYSASVQVIWLIFAQHAEYWLPYRNYLL
ncbi:EpsG family protein [Sphingomonas sp. LM7]|uniref:EpsG family protein n=1 Tax=Sphingomonas sp. LM7 TaxID=1938607 RepID=UPI000983B85A|nr:EpsG family protein [Sphingomonas sp. LM7]AQR75546.1 hypothetical protein BXU08_19470 [Sphingomonas sp. LM7]